MASSTSRTTNPSGTSSTTEDEDIPSVEDIEQLCSRMGNYDPCFRVSLLQHHLKRFGITCNDDRLVKVLSLSFESMIRSTVADCARVQQNTNGTRSTTLTSEILAQALLDNPTTDTNIQTTPIPQSNVNTSSSSTFDPNSLFDF